METEKIIMIKKIITIDKKFNAAISCDAVENIKYFI